MTKELITNGIKNGIISFIDDFGIRCKIGDNSFYFLGAEGDEITLEEFNKTYTENEKVNLIYSVLENEQVAEDSGLFEDEYGYYMAKLMGLI